VAQRTTRHPDDVAAELRRDIPTGVFEPGVRLVELQLCERYRCGRAAVRAALGELDGEGLVSREVNRGATVRRISVDEAIQIAEARAALESLLAGRAATNATEAERMQLADVIARMRSAVDGGDHVTYSNLNAELHELIREIGRHQVASELVGALRNRAYHHQFRLALMPGRPDESLEQHAAIVAAITSGDAARAASAASAHLRSVVEALRAWSDVPHESAALDSSPA
jgi:DNA-binding GntR family transcriptional regulator